MLFVYLLMLVTMDLIYYLVWWRGCYIKTTFDLICWCTNMVRRWLNINISLHKIKGDKHWQALQLYNFHKKQKTESILEYVVLAACYLTWCCNYPPTLSLSLSVAAASVASSQIMLRITSPTMNSIVANRKAHVSDPRYYTNLYASNSAAHKYRIISNNHEQSFMSCLSFQSFSPQQRGKTGFGRQ